MSLEAAILENTSVLRELLARLSSGAVVAAPAADAAKKSVTREAQLPDGQVVQIAPGQSIAKAVAAAAPASTTKDAAPAAASAASAAPASTAAEPITYDQVSKAITDGVKADRAKVVTVLAQFGAKKGTELKAEQYADFMAALL
jgi:hypothetical protein